MNASVLVGEVMQRTGMPRQAGYSSITPGGLFALGVQPTPSPSGRTPVFFGEESV